MIVMFASKHFLISILDIKFIYITSALGHTLINEKLVTYSQGHVCNPIISCGIINSVHFRSIL